MDIALILLLLGGIIVTVGDIFMKKWVSTDSHIFYIIGIIIYLIGVNFLAFSFKTKNIAVASVIFVIFNVSIISVVSWLYFKEALSLMQVLGILLGLVSIIVLEMA